jgi:glutamine amidotransferase
MGSKESSKLIKNPVIVDYGMGNVQSIANACYSLGYEPIIANDSLHLQRADCFILPGVGAFPQAISNITELGIFDILSHEVLINKKPVLGICLGMQLMANRSSEMGDTNGLGWVDAEVVAITPKQNLKIPHVGWNNLNVAEESALFPNIGNSSNYYFDHSFHFRCKKSIVTSTVDYGEAIVASFAMNNIFGTQFHPEKSQLAGLRVLKNFFSTVIKC